jgi:sec-independent protein translocase protein TatA
MGSLGMQEIIVIFLIALIIFGPRKLPELGKTIGKGLAEFKKASNELKQTWEDEVRLDKEKEAIPEPVVVPEPVAVPETVAVPEPIKETTIQDTTIQTSEVLNENKTPAESKENQ